MIVSADAQTRLYGAAVEECYGGVHPFKTQGGPGPRKLARPCHVELFELSLLAQLNNRESLNSCRFDLDCSATAHIRVNNNPFMLSSAKDTTPVGKLTSEDDINGAHTVRSPRS